jgi:hypothetical protein
MCFQTQCSKCSKYTYGGCGAHKKGVIERIKPDQVCISCPFVPSVSFAVGVFPGCAVCTHG